MDSFRNLFHSKISLQVLPEEYYQPFKLFYKSIINLGTFDIGALIHIIQITNKKEDNEAHINNVIQGFTIMTRKMQQSVEDAKRQEENTTPVPITLFHYSYLLAGLQFLIVNRQPPSSKAKANIILTYLKTLLPSKRKNSEFMDVYLQKLANVLRGVPKGTESQKVRLEDLPLPERVFINTILIFLQELCLIAPVDLDDKKVMKMLTKAKNVNERVIKMLKEVVDVKDIELSPKEILQIQDEQLVSLEYVEALFKPDKYPTEWKQAQVIDSLIRLNNISFDVSTKSIQRLYFDQPHFSNFIKIYLDNLVSNLYKKGKGKQELFRDNSIHVKII